MDGIHEATTVQAGQSSEVMECSDVLDVRVDSVLHENTRIDPIYPEALTVQKSSDVSAGSMTIDRGGLVDSAELMQTRANVEGSVSCSIASLQRIQLQLYDRMQSSDDVAPEILLTLSQQLLERLLEIKKQQGWSGEMHDKIMDSDPAHSAIEFKTRTPEDSDAQFIHSSLDVTFPLVEQILALNQGHKFDSTRFNSYSDDTDCSVIAYNYKALQIAIAKLQSEKTEDVTLRSHGPSDLTAASAQDPSLDTSTIVGSDMAGSSEKYLNNNTNDTTSPPNKSPGVDTIVAFDDGAHSDSVADVVTPAADASDVDQNLTAASDSAVTPLQCLVDEHLFVTTSDATLSSVGSFRDERSVAMATELASHVAPPEMSGHPAHTILTTATTPIPSIPDLTSLKSSPSTSNTSDARMHSDVCSTEQANKHTDHASGTTSVTGNYKFGVSEICRFT